MFVCQCNGVSDGIVRAHVRAGATSIGALAEACGAGADCQGCWPTLARLIVESERAVAHAT